jgi:hypothetical protein
MPTALAWPCPSGPVVDSTPAVRWNSGWPGVFEPHCRNACSSAIGRSKPARCKSEYSSIEPWPADSTKRSRSGQLGAAGSTTRWRCHRAYAMGAAPIGRPGWPLLARWIASIDSVRMVLMARATTSGSVTAADPTPRVRRRTQRTGGIR